MIILNTINAVKEFVKPLKKAGKTIGFVPTMGALHEGHLALGKEAVKNSDIVIYSIFVNPTQFAPGEDLDAYPRKFDEDSNKLDAIGVNAIFYPTNDEMYHTNHKTEIIVNDLGSILCGKSRATHFKGVTTVVAKLLNIVECDKAFFGKKDMQQFTILKKMVADLNMTVELFGIDIVRDKDGLALSSRNEYLSFEQRTQAPIIYKALNYAKQNISKFNSPQELLDKTISIINSQPLSEIEYIELRDFEDLEIKKELVGKMTLFAAVKFGKTRLIDNIQIEVGK